MPEHERDCRSSDLCDELGGGKPWKLIVRYVGGSATNVDTSQDPSASTNPVPLDDATHRQLLEDALSGFLKARQLA